MPHEVCGGTQSAACAHQFAFGGSAVGCDCEHAGAQGGGVGSVDPQPEPTGLAGGVVEERIGNCGLAASAQAMEDVDAVADTGFNGGAQPVHLPGPVAKRHGRTADRWAAYGVGTRPVGGVMVVLDDVLVTGGLVDAALAIGPGVIAADHR